MNNTIIGTINTATQFVGEIHQAEHLDGTFSTAEYLDGTFSNHEIPLTDYTGQYNYTPTESVQTVSTQYKSLGNNITIQAIPSDYIGSEVARRSESDVTASGDTVTAPSGYYEASVSKTVQAGTATTPTTSQTENPTISVDGSGIVTASYSMSFGITPTVEEGYVTSGTEGTVTVSGSASMQLDTESGKTITPTESAQTAVGENVYTLGEITVDAIPSDYVGSGIPKKSSSDLTASGATVSVPSGFYEESTSKSVQSGTEGTPTATKGAVSNHEVTVTPSVTNTAGYISGGTKTGTAVTVSASELVSGTKTITKNGENIDVVNYEDVTVNVAGGGGNLESGSATISGAGTVEHTPSVGYDGFDTFTTTTPSASSSLGTNAYYNFDGGNASWCLNHYIDVNSAGWVASGRTYGNTVYYGAVQSGMTITPSASSQTIGGENYMMHGAITVESAPLNSASRSYTPTESAQSETITPSSGNYGLDEVSVTVGAIPSNYVGSSIPRRDDDNISVVEEVDDAVVVASSGYYPSQAERIIPYVTGQQSVSYNSTTGVITATHTFPSSGYVPSGTEVTATGQVHIAHATLKANGTYYAVDDDNDAWTGVTVSVSAPSPTLQTKSKSYTPTESAQTETITADNGYDGLSSVGVSVSAIPSNYVGSEIVRRDDTDLYGVYDDGSYNIGGPAGYYQYPFYKTVPSASIYGGYDVFVTPSISVDASGLITAAVLDTRDFAFCFGSGWVNASTSTDIRVTAYNTLQLPSGTEGTPTATKGAVSNHSVSVTPSVTNTTGYITGGTKTGTAVSVSASELVSGSQTITENGDVDVTNLASVTVNVSGGGGGLIVATATKTLTTSASSIQFTGLSGNPLSFVITSSADQSTGGTKAVAVAYDGTSLHGMDVTTQAEADTGYTKSYSSGTLTVTATSATFEANEYKLVYTYGGSSSDIHTANVQVGSGATSITFSGLSGRPSYFSCVFKSSFSTSSGYQRVIDVVNDGTNTYGHAFDSSAKAQTSWSYSYSGGALTITSSGTNNGGYFHQPGYYQLTYAVDSSAPQYESVSKTYRASTSAQSDTIEPSSGYDAIEEVSVSIPAVTQTNLIADNIKSGTTISISNGQSNLWSVTGTYSGGGTSKNVQVLQSTSRTSSSSLTKVLGDLTVSKTGTYDIYWSGGRSNTSTSYTWGTRLYVDGTGYDTENTSWTNNCQSNHLTNVSLTANQKLSIYARGRSGSYYTFAPMLVIVEV